MHKSFIFDLNLCTGCHACAVACSIENKVPVGLNWRTVHTFNPQHIPEIPNFHLSLACNHCKEAPCEKYCPANAIHKDQETGVVLINEQECIGCRYCTWVCPYDAPKINPVKNIAEKCNFCDHRLEENLEPACVTLCPTGALSTGSYTANQKTIKGFKHYGIQPAIEIKPLRKGNVVPKISHPVFDQSILSQFARLSEKYVSKISAFSEWTLVIFTLFAAFLTGLFALDTQNIIKINPYLFSVCGLSAMTLSLLHLGEKKRFYRAAFNFRKSWLSREVTAFGLFWLLASCALFFDNLPVILNWFVIITGFLAVISMDMVYFVIPLKDPVKLYSAQVTLTTLTIISAPFIPLLAFFLALKMILYASAIKKIKTHHFVRIFIGLILPAVFLTLKIPYSGYFALTLYVVGEIIDRIEFYNNLEVITPELQIKTDLESFHE